MTARLIAKSISKGYRRRRVLADVSFEAFGGEILGIVGENGSGKSTLLRIVAGLLRADAGTVLITGRMGYCDQEPQLFPDLTVAEHFAYFARAYGLADGPEWMATRDGLLDHFGFAPYADDRVTDLSGGSRQKLHLSLALLHHPDVLVLDEPYAAFDWETYLRFWSHADGQRSRGAALVVVSHFAHERERFDRVLTLQNGGLQ